MEARQDSLDGPDHAIDPATRKSICEIEAHIRKHNVRIWIGIGLSVLTFIIMMVLFGLYNS